MSKVEHSMTGLVVHWYHEFWFLSWCYYNRFSIEPYCPRLTRWLSGQESACQSRRCRSCRFDPWVGKIPWRRKWQSSQNSCLENFMDRGAMRAEVHGLQRVRHDWVTQHTHTLPKRLLELCPLHQNSRNQQKQKSSEKFTLLL